MKRDIFNFSSLSLLMAIVFMVAACTDLEVKEKDSIVIESEGGEFAGVNPAASLASAYQDINAFGDQANWYALMEVASDELLVPTRGTDWGDNGVWRVLHTHDWDATHPQILTTWNQLNSNVFRLNQLLDPKSNASAVQTAEGKFLRAFNMFYIFDLWRQIPFRNASDAPNSDPIVLKGEEAFNFILNDLTQALPDLPTITAGTAANAQVRASKAAARFLLAKLYLNKHVFLNTTVQTDDMTKVVENVDAILTDGYNLAPPGEYFDMFKRKGSNDDLETIFWVNTCVCNKIWNGLHYNQFSPNQAGGWNGFSTTAEFYALFEGNPNSNEPGNGQEERRGFVPNAPGLTQNGIGYGFLVGQQYDKDGNKLKDRAGNDLIFTKDFPGLAGNNERTGIRVIKYHPENNGEYANGVVFYRYADAHLMKVEAILRGASGNAQALLDELRTARGVSSITANLENVLNERGRELYIEGWRRNDLVRFGKWSDTWALKSNTDTYRVLYPIPASAVSSNPNLTQNEGY
ncbi:MAG: RagB/SusD family nutrient uptake outer membrane protein [Cyclobacteriaceae bacterium]|nr:RagB/SusD family nutrient uptake outer membrane protein [Cyclobacteriaceae bacterium]